MSCDFLALANAGVRGLSPYQAGKPIEELQRELGLDRVIKLASNENPLGPSIRVMTACERAAAEISRYPDSNGFTLKAALAEQYGVQPEQLTLGCGSNDVLDLIARVFLGPGSSAVYSRHAFIVYALAVQAVGAEARVTPARDWGHDLDAMLAAIDETTRVVFVANPNNPTGTWLTEQQLESFLQQVPQQVLVVLDEAYIEYAEPALQLPDGIALQRNYPNLIVTRTFSKAYGLAGLRVGYSIAVPQVADLLNRVRAPFNVNSLALAAATTALSDQQYIEHSRQLNRQGLQQLRDGLEQLGLQVIPSAGNFLAFATPGDAMPVYQALLQQGVIVRPVGVYDMPGHLRVSVGLAEENAAFLAAMQAIVDTLP